MNPALNQAVLLGVTVFTGFVAVGALLLGGFVASGCASQQRLSAAPPTPQSVTPAEPGGDADDPHSAALRRQLDEPWGRNTDKDRQLILPLADRKNWKRVRFWGVDHFTGFRYGDDHHMVTVAFIQDVGPGERLTSRDCLRRFEAWAMPQARGYMVEITSQEEQESSWRGKPLIVRKADGVVPTGFKTEAYSGAWAAYPAYSDACLIYAVAVPWRDHPELAREVRDRWVSEGLARVKPKTKVRPFRK